MIEKSMEQENKRGRPDKYKPEYCKKIVDFMSDGSSLTAFAAEIEVSKNTVYEWAKKYPDFQDAINVARQKCQAWWEKQGRTGLFMGIKDGTFSQSVWIFNMKARFGYRDKVEHSVEVSTIKIEKQDEEL